MLLGANPFHLNMEWPGRLRETVDLLQYRDFEDFCFLVKATSAGRKFHEYVYKDIHLRLLLFCIVAINASIKVIVGKKRSAAQLTLAILKGGCRRAARGLLLYTLVGGRALSRVL